MTAFEELGMLPELGKAVDEMEWTLAFLSLMIFVVHMSNYDSWFTYFAYFVRI